MISHNDTGAMPVFQLIHDLPADDGTGRTTKERNLEDKSHDIPIGTLVEVKYDRWHGDGACEKVHARLWVVDHTRDCDGTPLYTLSRWKDPNFALGHASDQAVRGFLEEQLTPIEVADELRKGYGALGWDDA